MDADQTISKPRDLIQEAARLLTDTVRLESKKGDRYAGARAEHPNVGKPWTPQQDEELERLFTGGNTVGDLAPFFGRSRNAIRLRLEFLRLIEPRSRTVKE